MTTTTQTHDEKSVRTLKAIAVAALVAMAMAAAAGLTLLVADPTAGSTFEGVLGVTAAVAGLSVAALMAAAAIYAQVKGLWDLAPRWIRTVFYAVLVVAIIRTVFNLVEQLLAQI